MCYSSFRGVRTRDRRWKGVGKRRGSGRWSFKLRRRNRWNEIEMHSPRSRPLRRPPGLFPVYSSRSLLKEEGRWARKERRDVEEKEKENLHQQTADCQLPYKYININSVYIYIYIALWLLFTKIYQRSPSAIVTWRWFLPRRGSSFEAETEGDEQGSRSDFPFTRFSSPSFSVVQERAQNRKRQSRTPEANEATRSRYFRRVIVITFVRSLEYNVCYCFLSLSYD